MCVYIIYMDNNFIDYLTTVYSLGKANECSPIANILGKRPALGIMFHDNFNVTFLFALKKKKQKINLFLFH